MSVSAKVDVPTRNDARTAVSLGATALRLYAIAEVREALGVSHWQVYQLINSRQLKSVKIGRRRLVPAVELANYIESLRLESSS